MPLLRPTPGEIYDRLSILELKQKHGWQQHFHDEIKDLLAYFQDNYRPTIENSFPEALAYINGALWELEDSVRLDPTLDDYKAITRLNDERQGTIRHINRVFGCDRIEKLYKEPR